MTARTNTLLLMDPPVTVPVQAGKPLVIEDVQINKPGPRNAAVAPSNGRVMQHGDILVAEITPSYRGQLAQICRTATLGPADAELKHKYGLLVHAMDAGIAAARPGVPMASVCGAINTVLEAEGYTIFTLGLLFPVAIAIQPRLANHCG